MKPAGATLGLFAQWLRPTTICGGQIFSVPLFHVRKALYQRASAFFLVMVQCLDCGPFRLDPTSQRSWLLDDEWLIRKLRGALDIAAHSTVSPIAEGVWDIGRDRKSVV